METGIIFKQMDQFEHKIWRKQFGAGGNPPFETPIVFDVILFIRFRFWLSKTSPSKQIKMMFVHECSVFVSAGISSEDYIRNSNLLVS